MSMDQGSSQGMHLLVDLQACQSLVHGKRGIGIFSGALVRGLLQHAEGRRVSFLINGDTQESAIELRRELLEHIDLRDIHVWSGPLPRNARDEQNSWRNDAAQSVRDALIAAIKPDCVLFLSFFEGWLDDCICSLPSEDIGVATAVVVYDLIPWIYPDIYLSEPRLRSWYLSVLRNLGGADAILTDSSSSRQEVLDALGYSPHNVLSISGAVDERYVPVVVTEQEELALRAKLKLDKPFVMYTGGIDHRKNVDLLVEAFAAAAPFSRSHQLAIVCSVSPEEVERLRVLARRAGLASDALVLTGFVSDEDLLKLYNLCELFVFPSWHEGFGLPVLEAMSVGAPVIASNGSSLPEVIGPNGEMFDPRDKQSIADAIIRVLSDDVLRKRLASQGLERSKEFSWTRTAMEAWKGIEIAVKTKRDAASIARNSLRRGKPRLAYVSPLPPQQSGIADFSSELIPVLTAHYDIELIADNVDRPIELEGVALPVRDASWFLANFMRYDRVLYHFGNSEFHCHMFDMLAKTGGTVALHDFYLGNLHHWMQDTGRSPGVWQRALYEGYGYHALRMLGETADRNVTAFRFPCNWSVISGADGLIVHSEHSLGLVKQWYGKDQVERFAQIPHLRKLQYSADRAADRSALGLIDKQLVVASFGMLSASKCNDSLLEAWLAMFAERTDCKLVFVGRPANPEWEQKLYDRINAVGAKNVVITGFADAEAYRRWLSAADIAVQLRRQSRGETSGAILDCLAWGLPTIVNAHGSLAELPGDVVIKLDDDFSVDELATGITKLIDSTQTRASLAQAGRDYLVRLHDPAQIARQYSAAVEAFYQRSHRRILRGIVEHLTVVGDSAALTFADRDAVAMGLSPLLGRATPRPQLLLDISELVRTDARSGIQRVVRSILSELLKRGDSEWRVEPVYTNGDGIYRYARQFSCNFLGCPETGLGDDPIDVSSGDLFVGLDLAPSDVPAAVDLFTLLKVKGVEIVFILYDMLPLAHPEWFPPNASAILAPWYRTMSSVANRVVAISRSVADEFAKWLDPVRRKYPLELSWFHLGADVQASMPSRGISSEESGLLKQLRQKNVVLMVGTIEPRKGHDQALDAFVTLRKRNVDAELVVVGKQGWCVEQLVERLVNQVGPASGITWFSSASDELLDHLYDAASLLLVASRGEGFGLPIIEAGMRGVTVLARDLPVFREVGGDGIFYFNGETGEDLADAIERSLEAVRHGVVPDRAHIAVNSWAASAEGFLDAVTGKSSYRTWLPG